jgi:two-component system cell cycle sensor histidine kinase/response regulator CckA
VEASKASILVLDDDDAFRSFLVAALTGVGYSVVDTGNANEAIALLNGDAAFDLLIADVKMPSRQPHGIAVGNIARLKRSQIKIIYISGAPGQVPSGFIDTAETPLLGKPITLKTLLSAVEAALAAPS